jgi:GT2 family glycosyltransferase
VLADCVASFRSEARAAGVEGEVVLIEQSEDRAEAERAAGLGADRLELKPNRGYAAGLNAGIAAAGGGILLLANPDTVLKEGSLRRLVEAIDEGYEVVGPQLVWDDGGEILFPPAEDPRFSAELWRTLRARRQRAWSAGLHRVLDGWWQVWTASGTIEVAALRGPLLAARRAAVDRLGPLDEGYFLYYEETEWLLRARRRGARFAVAAGARVVHRAGHATAGIPGRAAIEAASRERFFARNYGALSRRLLRRCASGGTLVGAAAVPVAGPRVVPEQPAELWLVATSRDLMPAAGVVGRPSIPEAVARVASGGPWYAAAAARDRGRWRLTGCWSWGGQ